MAERLLILGGTAEAVALATAVAARFPDLGLITSLAGVTSRPTPMPGDLRTGGFGGAEGLAAYLADAGIAYVIDATHPFAAQIARNAEAACRMTGTPRLKLLRPMWQRAPEDTWIETADAVDAAAKLAAMTARSVFLTLGVRDLQPFATLTGVSFVVRLIEAPAAPLPINARIVTGRGPFGAADERRLMETHGIDVLVTKASGGTATEGKMFAARALGLPVLVIRRPEPPPGDLVADVAAALDWLDSRLVKATSTP